MRTMPGKLSDDILEKRWRSVGEVRNIPAPPLDPVVFGDEG